MDDTLWQQAAFSSKQLDSAPFVDPGSLSSLSPPEQQSDESSSPSSGDDIQVRPSPAKRQQQQQQQSERVSAQQQQTATMPIHKVARGSPDTSHESHGKRQGADIAHGALKDRKPLASSRRESRGSDAPHSHAALLDDPSAVADDAFEDDDAGGDPKSRKGAKTSERRKQQNRAAQRAFRERKEKHLQELEARVHDLEEQSTEKDRENSNLRDLLTHLRQENERLRVFEASAFNFSFDDNVKGSPNMPLNSSFAANPREPPASSLSSQPSVSPTTSLKSAPQPPAAHSSASLSSTSTPNWSASSDSTRDPSKSPDATTGLSPMSNEQMFEFLNMSALGGSSASPSNPSSAPAFSPGLFAQYRDPSASEPTTAAALTSTDTSAPLASDSYDNTSFGFKADGTVDFDSFFQWPASTPAPSSQPFDTADAGAFDFLAALSAPPSVTASSAASSVSPPAFAFGPSPVSNTSSPQAAAAAPSPSPLISDELRAHLHGIAASVRNGVRPSGVRIPRMTPAQIEAFIAENGGVCPLGMPSKGDFDFDEDGLCHEMKLKAVCHERARAQLAEAMAEDSKAGSATAL